MIKFVEETAEWVRTCLSKEDPQSESGREFRNYALTLDDKGDQSVYALMVPPQLAFEIFAQVLTRRGVEQAVLLMDRNAKPNQGTELDSVVSFYLWQKNVGWSCAIMEYSSRGEFETRPVQYDNAFWSEAMRKELGQGIIQHTNGVSINLLDFLNRDWDFLTPKEDHRVN